MKLDIFDYERRIQIFGGDEEAMALLSSKIVSTVNQILLISILVVP
jgi:hypothetical protein